ncbi:hypothetical protein [Streptomyces ficellus]|uniref:Uncharacterized protein n=1 Tax=Streptomyces ficellus TaxID=1977088 RepID=A0A6I6FKX1_9ACTN|nr:hypothetical protein [Streptomyces ficellus]QGV79519.1 hypothetical protein EIZ62_15650 [Streptomyces ficellus]
MAAHVTLPGRHRRTGERATRPHVHRSGLAVLAVCAVLYGLYAEVVVRHGDGPFTGGQAVLAVVSMVGFGLLWFAFLLFRRALPRELRAAAFGLLVGISVGFLYSLSGNSVLTVAVVSLVVAAGSALAAFYVYYTHETPARV